MKIRMRFAIVVVVLVALLLLIPPAEMSSRADNNKDRDDAQVVKVASGCTRKCRDLCAALPTKSEEDPMCDWRCGTISSVFNGSSIQDPAALNTETASVAVQEIQMCWTGCYLGCIGIVPPGPTACKDKCTDTFRLFVPAMAALDKTMAQMGLAAQGPAGGMEDFMFQACGDACSRKCAARAAAGECRASCAEACGFYVAATRVLQDAMLPAAVPNPAKVADDTVASTFKACSEHCASTDKKTCATKCSYAGYVINKAKASMMLATGGVGLLV